MTEAYLDIAKSVMISSPAGSGKTEKLARRYISLLKGGSEVERILAITFTEKASAEMKERILKILQAEDAVLFGKVREKMPRMRISTIHSFCLKLLKRFSMDLGLDPSLEVMDEFSSDILWSEAVYESLRDDGLSGERLFYESIKERGIKGWNRIYAALSELHAKRPHIELVIRCGGRGDAGGPDNKLERIFLLYKKCLERYSAKKRGMHCLDYNDLELMAFEAISRNPEWQNILFSFDEHTDHILVDEFQDTSSFQWRIIDKLTEEWRSGIGSKRDAGIMPTLFLVGDDKQSIYSFRGANVGIFRNTRNMLSEWLGNDYTFIEARDNYRSLPSVIDFVNSLFERLMTGGSGQVHRTEYIPFEAVRKGDGRVELSIIEGAGAVRDDRKAEAAFLAARIRQMHGACEVYDRGRKRVCNYGDMAILLRSRTHLLIFEDELRKEGIPFVIVKGVGFYKEPEIALLVSMLFFIIDPMDDYSLFNVLRSPLFSFGYGLLKDISIMSKDGPATNGLYGLLCSLCERPRDGILNGLQGNAAERIRYAVVLFRKWIETAKGTPYSIVLEEILSETRAWRHLHERQRLMNAKKFIRLVEQLESKGLGGLEIRETLIKASGDCDEPKANINTEGMDAVKIMTVHASKGLEFPIVFIPCLDEVGRPQRNCIAMDEDGDRITIAYEDDPDMRKNNQIFQRQKERAVEEDKRLFYVASTRAMDYLCMSGVMNDEPKGKLQYLFDAFSLDGLQPEEIRRLPFMMERFKNEGIVKQPFSLLNAVHAMHAHERGGRNEMVFVEPIDKGYKPAVAWHDVTEDMDTIRRRHGENWVVLGRAFHRVFEGLSKMTICKGDIEEKARSILRSDAAYEDSLDQMKDIIVSDIKRLDDAGFLDDIILPRKNSFAELPFILAKGGGIYKGRIDRVIIQDDNALIYDYKTYPASERDISELTRAYMFQVNLYKEAVEEMFSMKAKAFLFFTHELRIAGC